MYRFQTRLYVILVFYNTNSVFFDSTCMVCRTNPESAEPLHLDIENKVSYGLKQRGVCRTFAMMVDGQRWSVLSRSIVPTISCA